MEAQAIQSTTYYCDHCGKETTFSKGQVDNIRNYGAEPDSNMTIWCNECIGDNKELLTPLVKIVCGQHGHMNKNEPGDYWWSPTYNVSELRAIPKKEVAKLGEPVAEKTCDCDHCGKALSFQKEIHGAITKQTSIAWCNECLKDNKTAIDTLGVSVMFGSEGSAMHKDAPGDYWPAYHFAFDRMRTIPKKVTTTPKEEVKPMPVETKSEEACNCDHCDKEILFSQVHRKAAKKSIAWCNGCLADNKDLVSKFAAIYLGSEGKAGKEEPGDYWEGPDTMKALKDIPKTLKEHTAFCDHCGKTLNISTLIERLPNHSFWCTDCFHTDKALLEKAKVPTNFTADNWFPQHPDWTSWAASTPKVLTIPKKTMENSAVCDCCKTSIPKTNQIGMLYWCQGCIKKHQTKLQEQKIPHSSLYPDGWSWAYSGNMNKLKAIVKDLAKVETVITTTPTTETKMPETTTTSTDKPISTCACDHCGVSLKTEDLPKGSVESAAPPVYWCKDCFITDRSLLNGVSSHWTDSKAGIYGWGAKANVEILKLIPKKSNVACDHCEKKFHYAKDDVNTATQLFWCKDCITADENLLATSGASYTKAKDLFRDGGRWTNPEHISLLKTVAKKPKAVEVKVEAKEQVTCYCCEGQCDKPRYHDPSRYSSLCGPCDDVMTVKTKVSKRPSEDTSRAYSKIFKELDEYKAELKAAKEAKAAEYVMDFVSDKVACYCCSEKTTNFNKGRKAGDSTNYNFCGECYKKGYKIRTNKDYGTTTFSPVYAGVEWLPTLEQVKKELAAVKETPAAKPVEDGTQPKEVETEIACACCGEMCIKRPAKDSRSTCKHCSIKTLLNHEAPPSLQADLNTLFERNEVKSGFSFGGTGNGSLVGQKYAAALDKTIEQYNAEKTEPRLPCFCCGVETKNWNTTGGGYKQAEMKRLI